jgi:hypothetical protein
MVTLAVIENAVFTLRCTTCSFFAAAHTHIASRTTELAFFFFLAQLNSVILKFFSHSLNNIQTTIRLIALIVKITTIFVCKIKQLDSVPEHSLLDSLD